VPLTVVEMISVFVETEIMRLVFYLRDERKFPDNFWNISKKWYSLGSFLHEKIPILANCFSNFEFEVFFRIENF